MNITGYADITDCKVVKKYSSSEMIIVNGTPTFIPLKAIHFKSGHKVVPDKIYNDCVLSGKKYWFPKTSLPEGL